ncbi:MAG: arsenical pump-driving ATPase [Planctomycetes bacterium]|nr:arsenical pump-driving ATPase [Planctomycetota bacterium]
MTGRFLFFTGKGGVGKTTLACATAVRLAQAGERVLLVSTDPASNLSESLGVEVGPRAVVVPDLPTLSVLNVDPAQAAEDYRQRVLAPYADTVSPEALQTLREELSGACTVEIAAFDRFAGLLGHDEAEGVDRVVFDTAPTGHTLRLLELPRAWTNFLESNTRGASCLGPHGALTTRRDRFAEARAALEDPALTTIVLVARPDVAALKEAARTAAELNELGLANQHLVINGLFQATDLDDPIAVALEQRGQQALSAMPAAIAGLVRSHVALRPFETIGLAALAALLEPDPRPPREAGAAPAVPALARLAELVDELQADPCRLLLVMGKGGVGKTTIAAALAVELAARGVDVLLSTTDPAAHLAATVEGQLEHLEVSRIDPAAETRTYVEFILRTKGKDLDEDGRALLLEDLDSPCTEEVAVFHAFSRIVNRARGQLVILDTAPTGHTLLLLDAAGSYHREVLKTRIASVPGRVTTPLMRLQDPAYSRVLLVALAETTPVSEAAALQEDLRRAGIDPYAWVVNASLAAAGVRDPLLRHRAALELVQLERIRELARAVYVVPWALHAPRGVDALRELSATPAGR